MDNLKIVLALILFVLEAFVLGSPLKHEYKRKILYKPRASMNIVGGVEVTPHSIPYQVGIIVNSAVLCGGVLISTKYVLTVAHCTYQAESIAVILGAHNILCEEDTQVVLYNPMVINHANYSASTYNNDIALLNLYRHVPPTFAIKAVSSLAPKNSDDFVGCNGHISGWGSTFTGSHIPLKLRKAIVEIIANERCLVSPRGVIPKSNMCTLGTDDLIGPVGACDGDSGGPLVVGNVLVGLVSYGDSSCEMGYPTVYTRISYYRQWITMHSGV